MVFLSRQGGDRLEPPRGTGDRGYPRPTLGEARGGRFLAVLWVSLAERRCVVELPARRPTPSARPGPRYEIAWRVHDPVVAARSALTEERAGHLIAHHLGTRAAPPGQPDPLRQPPPHHGTVQVVPPGEVREVPEAGLRYWLLDPPAGFLPGPGAGAGPTLPPVFGEAHREAYRFYREVVVGGPADLAAFWLLQHPDQARDVLDWTVAHRDLLTDRDGWERRLAATLRGLTKDDRSYVGVHLAQVLTHLGIPQGEEVLRRLHHEPPPPTANGSPGTPA
ncbi:MULTISPECIES: hypothetical protein [Streptomyces]|uniref:hypothetical protein n=1 Tax=Streptomyces TaxID=1883 RepID=UPI0022487795|nr:hypothetical protein [Streptomyces sp. JHD 1]MCX2970511.1 hypothetical protein [Streptomyces sp. JHD 1]